LAPVPAAAKKRSIIEKYGVPFVKTETLPATFSEDLKLQEVSFEELMKK